MDQRADDVRHIAIVGGGTAGWMAAAALGRAFHRPDGLKLRITLIESEAIGTVGVGEATIPPIRQFVESLGLSEDDFIRSTAATAKLGIAFKDWSGPGSEYFHGFGDYGPIIGGQAWRQYLFRLKVAGRIEGLEAWSMPTAMAGAGKFAPPVDDSRSVLSRYSYAYQFDAGLFARRLRTLAETLGVQRREGRVEGVLRDGENGLVKALKMQDGDEIAADLFIDCSGFRGLLIEQTMEAGYEDWTHWLPCDRAVALPCAATRAPEPLTTARARDAGWQWRIPLQHRVGNGYVYCSDHIDDQTALDDLLGRIESTPLAEPNRLRFVTGRRREAWKGNVVALGLASGFVEPLESTSINLIQTGIGRLLELFPDRRFDPALIREYNRRSAQEFERIRDFIVLHYHLAGREGAMWDQCRRTPPPDTLAAKIDLFRARGEVGLLEDESFRDDSWTAVFTGSGVWPRRASPLVEIEPLDAVERQAKQFAQLIARAVATLPDHSNHFTGYAR
nr:tryptophan halogenase family protein [uncultured Brevundimonas sp.]